MMESLILVLFNCIFSSSTANVEVEPVIPTEPVPPINLAESDQFFSVPTDQNMMFTPMGGSSRPQEAGGDDDEAPQQVLNSVADHHEHSYSLPYHVSVKNRLFFLQCLVVYTLYVVYVEQQQQKLFIRFTLLRSSKIWVKKIRAG